MTDTGLALARPAGEAGRFDSGAAAPDYRGDPERVRARLNGILDEARAAEAPPWDADIMRLYRAVFPQLSLWLPAAEAERLCQAFECELARLEA